MAEHRRIWPLLVYGGLAAIAAVRRKEPERTSDNDSYEAVRKPYRTTYPAPDQSSEIRGEASPAMPGDPDKRPKGAIRERSADFGATESGQGAGQGTARRGAVAHSLGRVEGYPLARLCERE